jgi:hypothetical protein
VTLAAAKDVRGDTNPDLQTGHEQGFKVEAHGTEVDQIGSDSARPQCACIESVAFKTTQHNCSGTVSFPFNSNLFSKTVWAPINRWLAGYLYNIAQNRTRTGAVQSHTAVSVRKTLGGRGWAPSVVYRVVCGSLRAGDATLGPASHQLKSGLRDGSPPTSGRRRR